MFAYLTALFGLRDLMVCFCSGNFLGWLSPFAASYLSVVCLTLFSRLTFCFKRYSMGTQWILVDLRMSLLEAKRYLGGHWEIPISSSFDLLGEPCEAMATPEEPMAVATAHGQETSEVASTPVPKEPAEAASSLLVEALKCFESGESKVEVNSGFARWFASAYKSVS